MRDIMTGILFCLAVPVWASSGEPSAEALEQWFESDEQVLPYVDDVSEGELRFLVKPPDKRTTSISNKIDILNTSIESGWVDIEQCYGDLDPIDAVEVVYRYHNMRNLKILSTENIKKAWVEQQSVQLNEVEKGAKLCVSLQAQIFYKQDGKSFALRNGPFERKFLDGYFPLHVKLRVFFPEKSLRFTDSKPAATPGFTVRRNASSIEIDTWFEGKLTTELFFEVINH